LAKGGLLIAPAVGGAYCRNNRGEDKRTSPLDTWRLMELGRGIYEARELVCKAHLAPKELS